MPPGRASTCPLRSGRRGRGSDAAIERAPDPAGRAAREYRLAIYRQRGHPARHEPGAATDPGIGGRRVDRDLQGRGRSIGRTSVGRRVGIVAAGTEDEREDEPRGDGATQGATERGMKRTHPAHARRSAPAQAPPFVAPLAAPVGPHVLATAVACEPFEVAAVMPANLSGMGVVQGELAPALWPGTRSGSPWFEDPSASEDPEDHVKLSPARCL